MSLPLGRLIARLRHRGLENPLLPLPAVLIVAVGFFVPLVILAVYSFWPTVNGKIVHDWTLGNYTRFFTQETYWRTLLRSFLFVGIASAITVVLTFPFAYFVATKVRPRRRLFWVLVAIIPFWTSYLIRVFAWLNMFGDEGLLNKALQAIGLTSSPIGLFGFDKPAIVITFVYLLFPLAFLTIYIAIERMNPAMLEASADLGAKPWRSLTTITLPIARTGLVAGFIFSFISMMGDYATPQLIGGTNGVLYSNLIINQFNNSMQWGFGATLAMLLLVSIFLLLVVLRTAAGKVEAVGEYTMGFTHRRAPFLLAYSLLYLVFLYTPPALLVLLAFNDSPQSGLPFVGFTTHWFSDVFHNVVLVDSLWTSVQVAVSAVIVSVVLGTLAAVQISRARGKLRGFNLGMIAVPLFLPPVVLGLAIIIGLNALGIERGLWTIVAGHVIITLPVVTLMVLVRLEGLDRNQELAAMDLGARPWRAFFSISVPQALPGIVAGAMIAFAMSMDEFILTFLVTGSQQTLPLYIFGSLRIRVTPDLNAISALMLGASFLLLTLGVLIAIGRDRIRRREEVSRLPAGVGLPS
ncbi:MAG: ABC transporter permease subunit [Thermoleophilaceae bacterium]|nr:ABC transporter permease subunit [Thermoleophilaceae bacterium]